MAPALTEIRASLEEYLHREKSSDVKHEYDNGYIVAMAGASRSRNLITLTLASEIKQHLKGKSGRTYISNMKAPKRIKKSLVPKKSRSAFTQIISKQSDYINKLF